MALYCHPEDKGFGASIFCKVLVVNLIQIINYYNYLYYFLCIGLRISIGLVTSFNVTYRCGKCKVKIFIIYYIINCNKSNFRLTEQLNMKLYWDIIYMAIAIFTVILLPFAILFYESDPDKTLVQIM